MKDFVARMQTALQSADRLLAVCTEAYFASAFGGAELRAAFTAQAGAAGRIVPVLVEPVTLPPLHATLIPLDLTALDEAAAAERLRDRLTGGRPTRPSPFPPPAPSDGPRGRPRFAGARPTTRGESMKVLGSLRTTLRAVLVAALSALLFAGLVGTASAAPSTEAPGASACAGRSVPACKVSIQLWTFAEYIGLGSDAATQARHVEVLRRLSEMGYRNVEPFTLSGFTAEQYAALLSEYGLQASGRHVDVGTPESPVNITQILEENRILGVEYFGSGSTPRTYTTEAQWTAYAQYLDTVGEQARQAGQTLMIHNHNWEFAPLGDGRTGFDILMQHTEPRNVVFQLDLYWATFAGADPVQLIEEYGNRIQLFHVKDLNPTLNNRIEIVGRGNIDFPSIFAAAGGSTRYFVVEHDPRFGDPTFNPFEAAQEGFAYLTCTSY